jgi:myo-inositol-1-phosphate synthase
LDKPRTDWSPARETEGAFAFLDRAAGPSAAPLVLDLVLLTDLAQRAGLKGVQEWLSFFFKSPQHAPSVYPDHDLSIQQTKLKNTLRWLMGEDQITHLGMEYYQD